MPGSSIAYADFNLDGLIDIFVSDKIYLNGFTGSTLSFTAVSISSAPGSVSKIAAVDMNGDNKPDLIYTSGSGIRVALNNYTSGALSNSSFMFAPSNISVASSGSLIGLALFDKDHDGDVDIIAYGQTTKKLYVLENQGSMNFVLAGSFDVANNTFDSNYGRDIFFGDINADGNLDVIFNSWIINGPTIRNIWLGNSDLTFNTAVGYSFPNSANFHTSGAIGDINFDGKPDIISTSPYVQNYAMNNNIGNPVISSFTPNSGSLGTSITITGTYFTNASSVRIGGTAVQSFSVDSDTQITAIAGPGTDGTISVVTPEGTATSSGSFIFPPSVNHSLNGRYKSH